MALKRRGTLFRALERVILGMGMTVVAFFIERRLIKAIKKGGVEPAPRTAGASDDDGGASATDGAAGERQGRIGLTVTPHQVADKPKG